MDAVGFKTPVLKLAGITKQFGDVRANSDVDFAVSQGEIVGLLGENGAGKTTLMNVAFGLYRPDAGTISVSGSVVDIASTAHAMSLGIGMVQQHAHVIGRHTVLENILAGMPGRHGLIDRRAAIARMKELGERYGLNISPDRLASSLSVGEKQRLDIIRALFRPSRLLILDEPTSVLTPTEIDGLFSAVKSLARDGMGIVLISHKLKHVRYLTDRIVVMRQGIVVAEKENDRRLTDGELAILMCGHQPERVERKSMPLGPPLLELRSVVLAGQPQSCPIDLTIRTGEIVGIAGVAGNGQVALAETVVGLRRAQSGTVSVARRLIEGTVAGAMAAGVGYIPEDRLGAGLVASMTVSDNLVLSRFRYPPFSRFGWLNRTAMRRFARGLIERYNIRPADPSLRISLLSGGNQQKAIVARAFEHDLTLLVVAQPTRGLDLGAASFVHGQILSLRERGCSVLLISEDLDELLQLSDRIAVLFEGGIVLDRAAEALSIAQIGIAMNGGEVVSEEAA